MREMKNLPLEHRLRAVKSEFPLVSNVPVLRGLGGAFRFVSTGDLNLIEDMGALVFAIIGEVNVKFNFRFSCIFFIGGFLGMTVIGFVDGRLQLKDGVCAVFPSQRGLEMLIRLQSRRQCDSFNSGGYQGSLLPF